MIISYIGFGKVKLIQEIIKKYGQYNKLMFVFNLNEND